MLLRVGSAEHGMPTGSLKHRGLSFVVWPTPVVLIFQMQTDGDLVVSMEACSCCACGLHAIRLLFGAKVQVVPGGLRWHRYRLLSPVLCHLHAYHA